MQKSWLIAILSLAVVLLLAIYVYQANIHKEKSTISSVTGAVIGTSNPPAFPLIFIVLVIALVGLGAIFFLREMMR